MQSKVGEFMTRMVSLGVASCILIASSGCGAMMHELQPHRLWRWNYQPQKGNSDGSYGAYFSVDDTMENMQKSDGMHVLGTP